MYQVHFNFVRSLIPFNVDIILLFGFKFSLVKLKATVQYMFLLIDGKLYMYNNRAVYTVSERARERFTYIQKGVYFAQT